MKELKDYYRNWKRKLQIISAPIWLLLSMAFFSLNECVSEYLNKWANNEIKVVTRDNLLVFKFILDVILDFVAPTAIVFLLCSRILKYVDEEGWKKKYPEYDISGEWRDITCYTQYLDKDGLSEINTPKEVSPVIIEQTCRKVRIKDSIGEGFKWSSLLCDWNNNNLDILYTVEYFASLQIKGYPEKRCGYESMCIDIKALKPNKKPPKMIGKFWHCCSNDGKPVYMGDVIYERDVDE